MRVREGREKVLVWVWGLKVVIMELNKKIKSLRF
jgi:hypothetical protein